ncbi:peroxiredoxin [Alkalihalobacillus sp. AL-G]|uniref:peroxiredoxin family protein n=1 Tax=Alkalihalobacillus sp. AL-G TaxID=2926399 RepID=UPI00272BFD8B|nr:TlpA disulfide reductase family protein [Alkalihalobacillus sp. AL-G]WLD94159.1 TlpA family protein disulfide reductase [Alkalihalobacillus sp. AL-G]
MKNKLLHGLLLSLTVLFGYLAWQTPEGIDRYTQSTEKVNATEAGTVVSNAVEIGNKAPNFKLSTLDGKTVSLSQYRGKTVILNFWTTWCTYCKDEIPELINFHHLHKEDDVVILAVNLSSEEESLEPVAMFSDELEIPFTVPLDKEGKVATAYKVYMIPTTYVIASDGTIQHKIIGPANLEQLEKLLF